MFFNKKSLVFLSLSLTLSGCLESSSKDSGYYSIPDIDISCSSAQATDCLSGNAGKTFYIGLLTDTSTDCSTYMDQITSGNFAYFFDISGSGTTTFSGTLNGNINNWVDNSNNTIFTMLNTTYKVCSFIDTNGNGTIGASEPLGQGLITPLTFDPVITDWY